MKTLFFVSCFILSNIVFSQSKPVSLKGLQDTAYQLPKQEIQVPNRQYTNTGGLSGLIETGNSNLLANPSFEHSTFSTGWSWSGTASEETTTVQDGKKSFRLTRSVSGAISLSQVSTINAAQYANQQGLAYCRLGSTFTGAHRICASVNGAAQVGSCRNIEVSTALSLYEMPFLMGGTSSGVVIESTTNGTGTVIVDDCYVGIIKPGMITETGAVGPWIAYTPTFTGFGTPTGVEFQYRQNGSSIDIRGKFISGTSTGTEARLGLPPNLSSASVASIPSLQGAGVYYRQLNTATSYYVLIEPSVSYVTFGAQNSGTNALTKQIGADIASSGQAISITASVPIAGLNSRVSLYSQQCRRPSDCENVFSAKVSAAGVVSDENLDWMSGNCTNANPRVCTFNTPIFTVAPNCSCSVSSPASSGDNDCAATATSTTVSIFTSSGNLGSQQATNIVCQKSPPDYKERNMITGTFRDVVTAPNTGSIKTCYYAFGGASATLASPTECTSGTCVEVVDTCGTGTPPTNSTTSLYSNLTFASGTWANSSYLKCECVGYDVTVAARSCLTYFDTGDQTWQTNSSGGAVLNMLTVDATGSQNAAYVNVKCEGIAP